MNTARKLFEAMQHNPLDWRIQQLQTVARQFGIECRHDGGSHCVFSHPAVADTVSIPAHRPIKPIYIRSFTGLVNKVKELSA